LHFFIQNKTTGDIHSNDHGTLLYSTIKVYQLKAGTLDKIVEYLTNDDGELDTTHMHILFSTYRTFTNTRTLIDTLINRYKTVLPASLDMTEDIRQKTLKYENILFFNFQSNLSYIGFFSLLILSVRFKSSMSIICISHLFVYLTMLMFLLKILF
jgi:hypothetical protein